MLRNIHSVFGGILLLIALSTSSCQKNHYIDSGVHDANFDGTILDYLKTRDDIFDTLVYVLELSGLDRVVDGELVTLFAPTDMSIHRAILQVNQQLYSRGRDTVVQLNQIDGDIWRQFLSRYILQDKYVLRDFPQLDTLNMQAFPGQGYVMYGGNYMNIGVLYNDVVTDNDSGDQQIIKYAGYRQLYLNAILDGQLITGPVATSDIQPRNGALHVLNMQLHTFGFTNEFANIISLRGINPID